MTRNQSSCNTGRKPLYVLLMALAIVSLGILVGEATSLGQSRNSGPDAGPVRLARFSYITGDVNWRRDPNDKWSAATVNLPIRQGAQVWAPEGCRAEIQFDDGSRLWLGSNALITLQTLYSDADGEFTEITLSDGPASMKLSNPHSVYQINSPTCSVEATGPARIRCSAEDHTKIEIFQGKASVEGTPGKATLRAGDYLDLRDPNSPYEIRPLPQPDAFDSWVSDRNRKIDGYKTRHAHRALPSNLALVGDDLDDYGTWRSVPRYGEVWCPRTTYSDWRPYRYGHWVWVDPYGWTWVADEPWGWAPYHYGSWVHLSFGWGWCPGPRFQYWSPARVAFTDYGGSVGWCPIAPAEVVYPSTFSIGFGGGDWSVFFSMGRAAVYYPYGSRFIADPWPVSYCNRWYSGGPTIVNNTTIVRNVTINRNTFITNPGFVPFNARAGGTILADRQTFAGRGSFRLASQQQSVAAFRSGRLVAAPARGQFAVAGPPTVRPTALAMTPTRTLRSNVPIPQTVLNRPVYRAPLKPQIARTSLPLARTLPVNRSPRIWTRTGGPTITNAPRTTGPATALPGRQIRPGQPGAQALHQPGTVSANPAPRISAAPNRTPTATERALRARANLGMPSKAANRNVSPAVVPFGANRKTATTGLPGRPSRPGVNATASTGPNRRAAAATLPQRPTDPGTRTAVGQRTGANKTAPNISATERARQARERVGIRPGGFRGPGNPGSQTAAGSGPAHGRPSTTASGMRTQAGTGRPRESRRTAVGPPRETSVPRVSHGGGQGNHTGAPRRTVRESPVARTASNGQAHRRVIPPPSERPTAHRSQPEPPEMRAYRRTRERPSATPRSVERREYRPAPRSMPSRPSGMSAPSPRSRPESPRSTGPPRGERRGGGGQDGGRGGNDKKVQRGRE